MTFRPPLLGEYTRDELDRAAEADRVRQAERAAEAVQAHEAAHLCGRCGHAPVCAIVAAIQSIDGDGDVTISHCGAFAPVDPGLDTVPEAAE